MNTKLIDTLWDIQYPKPMDGYHPKDQHMCTHIEALGHWNALTLSLWEVAWSSRVNIFTRDIGYIGPIMQSLQCRHFSILDCRTPTRSRPKVLGKSIVMPTLGQMKGDN